MGFELFYFPGLSLMQRNRPQAPPAQNPSPPEFSDVEYGKRWEPGPNPIQRDLESAFITPPDGDLMEDELTFLRNQMENVLIPPALRKGFGSISARKQHSTFMKGRVSAFARDFQQWLQGASKENLTVFTRGPLRGQLKTPWGTKSLFHIKEVQEYLTKFIASRMQFQMYLASLYLQWPRDLVESYIYFKYLVKGTLLSDGNSWMSDYKMFTDNLGDRMPPPEERADAAYRQSRPWKMIVETNEWAELQNLANRALYDPTLLVSNADRIAILQAWINHPTNTDEPEVIASIVNANRRFAIEEEGFYYDNHEAYLEAQQVYKQEELNRILQTLQTSATRAGRNTVNPQNFMGPRQAQRQTARTRATAPASPPRNLGVNPGYVAGAESSSEDDNPPPPPPPGGAVAAFTGQGQLALPRSQPSQPGAAASSTSQPRPRGTPPAATVTPRPPQRRPMFSKDFPATESEESSSAEEESSASPALLPKRPPNPYRTTAPLPLADQVEETHAALETAASSQTISQSPVVSQATSQPPVVPQAATVSQSTSMKKVNAFWKNVNVTPPSNTGQTSSQSQGSSQSQAVILPSISGEPPHSQQPSPSPSPVNQTQTQPAGTPVITKTRSTAPLAGNAPGGTPEAGASSAPAALPVPTPTTPTQINPIEVSPADVQAQTAVTVTAELQDAVGSVLSKQRAALQSAADEDTPPPAAVQEEAGVEQQQQQQQPLPAAPSSAEIATAAQAELPPSEPVRATAAEIHREVTESIMASWFSKYEKDPRALFTVKDARTSMFLYTGQMTRHRDYANMEKNEKDRLDNVVEKNYELAREYLEENHPDVQEALVDFASFKQALYRRQILSQENRQEIQALEQMEPAQVVEQTAPMEEAPILQASPAAPAEVVQAVPAATENPPTPRAPVETPAPKSARQPKPSRKRSELFTLKTTQRPKNTGFRSTPLMGPAHTDSYDDYLKKEKTQEGRFNGAITYGNYPNYHLENAHLAINTRSMANHIDQLPKQQKDNFTKVKENMLTMMKDPKNNKINNYENTTTVIASMFHAMGTPENESLRLSEDFMKHSYDQVLGRPASGDRVSAAEVQRRIVDTIYPFLYRGQRHSFEQQEAALPGFYEIPVHRGHKQAMINQQFPRSSQTSTQRTMDTYNYFQKETTDRDEPFDSFLVGMIRQLDPEQPENEPDWLVEIEKDERATSRFDPVLPKEAQLPTISIELPTGPKRQKAKTKFISPSNPLLRGAEGLTTSERMPVLEAYADYITFTSGPDARAANIKSVLDESSRVGSNIHATELGQVFERRGGQDDTFFAITKNREQVENALAERLAERIGRYDEEWTPESIKEVRKLFSSKNARDSLSTDYLKARKLFWERAKQQTNPAESNELFHARVEGAKKLIRNSPLRTAGSDNEPILPERETVIQAGRPGSQRIDPEGGRALSQLVEPNDLMKTTMDDIQAALDIPDFSKEELIEDRQALKSLFMTFLTNKRPEEVTAYTTGEDSTGQKHDNALSYLEPGDWPEQSGDLLPPDADWKDLIQDDPFTEFSPELDHLTILDILPVIQKTKEAINRLSSTEGITPTDKLALYRFHNHLIRLGLRAHRYEKASEVAQRRAPLYNSRLKKLVAAPQDTTNYSALSKLPAEEKNAKLVGRRNTHANFSKGISAAFGVLESMQKSGWEKVSASQRKEWPGFLPGAPPTIQEGYERPDDYDGHEETEYQETARTHVLETLAKMIDKKDPAITIHNVRALMRYRGALDVDLTLEDLGNQVPDSLAQVRSAINTSLKSMGKKHSPSPKKSKASQREEEEEYTPKAKKSKKK